MSASKSPEVAYTKELTNLKQSKLNAKTHLQGLQMLSRKTTHKSH